MNSGLYTFKYWMDYKVVKLSNREVIYDFTNKLLSLIDSLQLKTFNVNFKNEFIAFLYQHSKKSQIVKNVYNSNVYNSNIELDDEFIIKYEPRFLEFFDEMSTFFRQGAFNILDSNLNYQKTNFIDLIEKNIIFSYVEEENIDDIEEDYLEFE
tara:strand:+ start:3067 stop:3525 length:459 start_codon:yes stop_codon:yes gene_type:complete